MPRRTGGADADVELGFAAPSAGAIEAVGTAPLPLRSVQNARTLERAARDRGVRLSEAGGKAFVLRAEQPLVKNWHQMVDSQHKRITHIRARAAKEVGLERARASRLHAEALKLSAAEARTRAELARCSARETALASALARKTEDWRSRIERADREARRSAQLLADVVERARRLEAEARGLRARRDDRDYARGDGGDGGGEGAPSAELFMREVAHLRAENRALRRELLARDAADAAAPEASPPLGEERPPGGEAAGDGPPGADAASPAPPAPAKRDAASAAAAFSRPTSARATRSKPSGARIRVRGKSASLYTERGFLRVERDEHLVVAPNASTSRDGGGAPAPVFRPRPTRRQHPNAPPGRSRCQDRPCSAPAQRLATPLNLARGKAPAAAVSTRGERRSRSPAAEVPAPRRPSPPPRQASSSDDDRSDDGGVESGPWASDPWASDWGSDPPSPETGLRRPSTAPAKRGVAARLTVGSKAGLTGDGKASPRALRVYVPVPALARGPSPPIPVPAVTVAFAAERERESMRVLKTPASP